MVAPTFHDIDQGSGIALTDDQTTGLDMQRLAALHYFLDLGRVEVA